MSTCPSCGGILGRDCWNPQECAEITAQIWQEGTGSADGALGRQDRSVHAEPLNPHQPKGGETAEPVGNHPGFPDSSISAERAAPRLEGVTVENLIALAVLDGENIGRWMKDRTPEETIRIREASVSGRVAQVKALYAIPSPRLDREAVARVRREIQFLAGETLASFDEEAAQNTLLGRYKEGFQQGRIQGAEEMQVALIALTEGGQQP